MKIYRDPDFFDLSLREMSEPFRNLTAKQQATLVYFAGILSKCTNQEMEYIGNEMFDYDEDVHLMLLLISTQATTEQKKSYLASIPAKYKNDLIRLFLISLCAVGLPKRTTITQKEFELISAVLSNANITAFDISKYALSMGISVVL
ncbi:MAG: hypothetical protein LBM07_00035 [Culturomica sp.]|jgi:hypothetical protein|nr:hypothetical protein [Culturomica sp.]